MSALLGRFTPAQEDAMRETSEQAHRADKVRARVLEHMRGLGDAAFRPVWIPEIIDDLRSDDPEFEDGELLDAIIYLRDCGELIRASEGYAVSMSDTK